LIGLANEGEFATAAWLGAVGTSALFVETLLPFETADGQTGVHSEIGHVLLSLHFSIGAPGFGPLLSTYLVPVFSAAFRLQPSAKSDSPFVTGFRRPATVIAAAYRKHVESPQKTNSNCRLHPVCDSIGGSTSHITAPNGLSPLS